MNSIEINDLRYCIRDHWTFQLKELLSPFSLEVHEGEAFGFLGHNGAGKTTTIKCILGFLAPSSGAISVFGVDNLRPEARASIGYLSEQPYFYDYLTVRETLTLFAELSAVDSSTRAKVVTAAAEKVGIAERLDQRMRTLSKGLTQRVGLAQAILHTPKLLVLDEPFSGLDPIGRREFRDIFLELKQAGTTLFMSSHVLPDVEFLCDRVSILAQGKLKGVFSLDNLPASANATYELKLDGDRAKIKAELAPSATKIGEDREGLKLSFADEASANRALVAALAANYKVVQFSRERGGLEQLFESLVSFKEGARK
jgi:ABC-2 type transport system ATP-binding protein